MELAKNYNNYHESNHLSGLLMNINYTFWKNFTSLLSSSSSHFVKDSF